MRKKKMRKRAIKAVEKAVQKGRVVDWSQVGDGPRRLRSPFGRLGRAETEKHSEHFAKHMREVINIFEADDKEMIAFLRGRSCER